MRAITVHQPWASLIIAGVKRYETRPRNLSHRGPLAIHAGLQHYQGPWPDRLLQAVRRLCDGIENYPDALPAGAVIGTVRMVRVLPIVSAHPDDLITKPKVGARWLERDMDRDRLTRWRRGPLAMHYRDATAEFDLGDYTPGRFAYELADPQPIGPVPAKGMQGLWTWTGPD